MSYHVCGNCGEISHIFGHDGAKKTAEKMQLHFLGEVMITCSVSLRSGQVPLHGKIRELSDEGKPIVVAQPDSPQAKHYFDIAEKVRHHHPIITS